ncbi:MAG TPA: heavy metal translocating P-type ATPase [Gaiellaceae bacterium]|nr:heavy metal translocating P-type ATPase [Gaiellaceae bacterium]
MNAHAAHAHQGAAAAQNRHPSTTAVLHVGGLHYASERAVVERALGARPGVLAVEANPVAQTATVEYDPDTTSVDALRRWVEECGFHCAGRSVPGHVCDPMAHETADAPAHDHAAQQRADAAHGEGHGGHAGMSMEAMVRDMRNRFLVAAAFAIPIAIWSPMGEWLFGSIPTTPFGIGADLWQLLLSLPVVFYSSSIFFVGAWKALRARTLDMMVLVAVAIGTAFVYSVAATFWIEGEVFYEAAAFLASFVLLGHWFEMRARGGANDAIRALLDLAPPKAVVIRAGQEREVPTAEVAVGDLLLIRPGAKVAVDAEVLEGESSVDESMVTGESMPVSKRPGDKLVGATINKQGTLRARATAVGSATALAQIVKLVQEAQNSKAPAQRLADRAAFWLVLVALIGGLGTFFVWFGVVDRPVLDALLFAITVVVITCPDALGLATPTAIMVGTGLGAKRGILFKSAIAIEQSSRLNTVVLDKTGTLTRGEPEVVEIKTTDGLDEQTLLRLAAALERESEHPLAEAIVKAAATRGLDDGVRADGFEAIAGHGAVATVEGRRLAVGNARLLEREQVALDGIRAVAEEMASQGRTVVHVAVDGRAAGLIAIADAPRETAAEAVAALKELGVRPVMLTGDNHATAVRIAAALGIEEVLAEVLPADKAAKVGALQAEGRKVAMVGDGVNDAPALAKADVGIAIGAGTDVAIETADVVLMRSDPLDVATAITIGRGTVRKMRQNLGWAIGYNSLALPIAAGVFEPWGLTLRPEIAAISMSGSSILVAVNALALKRLHLPRR